MSRPFSFRLARVQDLRVRAEDQAREHLAHGMAARREGAARLASVHHTTGTLHDRTRGALRAGVSGADLAALHAFGQRVDTERREAELDLGRRDAEVEARRRSLIAAARDREVLDRLERSARTRHDIESARLAQGVLDEIALGVHRRAQVPA